MKTHFLKDKKRKTVLKIRSHLHDMFSLRDNFPAEMKSVVSITALALFLCNIFFMPFAIVLFYITIKFDEFLLLYFFIRSEIWLNKKIISNFFF